MSEETIPTKLCVACKENIHCNATLCKECGSYQNWRRYFNLSAVFMSLLIALISILTTFYTLLLGSYKSDSNTKIIEISRNESELVFYAKNEGDKSSRYGQLKVIVIHPEKGEQSFISSLPKQGHFIEPGNSIPFSFSFDEQLWTYLDSRIPKDGYEHLATSQCIYTIEIYESGETGSIEHTFDRPCASPYRKIDGNHFGAQK